MAKPQFAYKYKYKMAIRSPNIESSNNSSKIQAAAHKAISNGVIKGASYVETNLKKALNASISASVWSWPRSTLRKNGSLAGQTRDIVDLGGLKNSLGIKTIVNATGVKLEGVYETPYATLVHYGGVIKPYGNPKANDVIIPGRPWVLAVFDGTHGQAKLDVNKPFNKGLSEAWRAQFGT